MSNILFHTATVDEFIVKRTRTLTPNKHVLEFGTDAAAPWMHLDRNVVIDLIAKLQASLRAEASETAIATGRALFAEYEAATAVQA